MSEKNNLDSNNLCITEDAFEQFQVDSHYEEEEFITLSDIVSPEPLAPQLPKDITEIPYDNEVVLSNFDDNQPGFTETTDFCDAAAAPAPGDTSEQIDSALALENNVNLDQSVVHTPEDDVVSALSSRPKRTRKLKSYTVEFLSPLANKAEGKKSTDRQNLVSGTPSNKKRGRKPKHSLTPQNEPIRPEPSVLDTPLEDTPAPPKRGRRKVYSNMQPDMESQTSLTVKRSVGRRGRKPKVTPVEGDLPPEEQLNNLAAAEQPLEMAFEEQPADAPSGELIDKNNSGNLMGNDLDLNASSSTKNVQKKTPGRRGRKKKNPLEEPSSQLPKSNDVSNSSMAEANIRTSTKKRGRKKKSVQEDIATTVDKKPAESEDEFDNLSLQALSQINNSNGEDQVPATENKLSSDIDVEYDELGKVQDFLLREHKVEPEINTELQDMELDEPVDSSHNSKLLYTTLLEDLPVKIEHIENDANIGSDVNNDSNIGNGDINNPVNDSLLEESSKRPRRRAKKISKYEEESDEDPFANIELSDDEPSGTKKGKYHDDDEYVPEIESNRRGGKRKRSITESEDSDIDLELEDLGKKRKRSVNKTPQKRSRRDTGMSHESSNDANLFADINVTTIPPAIDLEDDIEVCLQSSVIHANKDKGTGDSSSIKSNAWSNTNAFESFIAQKIQGTNLQIKKVSSNQSSQNTPLEIPVLDPEAKKLVDKEVQTITIKKSTVGAQTTSKHETPMKNNVALSEEQSVQACEFLKSIVKTTSELGQLMTEKSEDFITKKINTSNVTDTFKMDYCVKKSFLLLKLAKHNIVQMEEDLSKQYEDFLKRTDLLRHKEEEKTITAKEKDSDSDCEIVEGPSQPPKSEKSSKAKFNPKTVFLNKELSIKIAKKPQQSQVEKKCRQLGLNKHSVWINDSVMVKKIKQTQSFLAQDSRNKKPPDCFVTDKMVSDFFENYYHKLAPSICAPFTSNEWLSMGTNYVCSYFFVKPDKYTGASGSFPNNGEICLDSGASSSGNNSTEVSVLKIASELNNSNPQSLLYLSTEVLKKNMKMLSFEEKTVNHPCTLFRLCVNALSTNHKSFFSQKLSHSTQYKKNNPDQPKNNEKLNEKSDDDEVRQHAYSKFLSNSSVSSENTQSDIESSDILSLKTLCYRTLSKSNFFTNPQPLLYLSTEVLKKNMKMLRFEEKTVSHPCTLFRLCVNALISNHKSFFSQKFSHSTQCKKKNPDQPKNYEKLYEKSDDDEVRQHAYSKFSSNSSVSSENTQSDIESSDILSLKTLCFRTLSKSQFFTSSNAHSARDTVNLSEVHVLSKCECDTDENSPTDDFDKKVIVAPTLLSLCHLKIVEEYSLKEATLTYDAENDRSSVCSENPDFSDEFCLEDALAELRSLVETKTVSSLLSLCVKALQEALPMTKRNKIPTKKENGVNDTEQCVEGTKLQFAPNSLKCISLQFIKDLIFREMDENENVVSKSVTAKKVKKLTEICFEIVSAYTAENSDHSDTTVRIPVGMTIDCVNTVSEDVFHNMEEENESEPGADTTLYDEDNFGDDHDNDEHDDNQNEDNSWVSQLKLQVQQDVTSCVAVNSRANIQTPFIEDSDILSEAFNAPEAPILVRIKQEPLEETLPETEVGSTTIKAEPTHHDEMVCLPENMIPKMELNHDESIHSHARVPLERRSSFDVDSFENFVRRNKMMHALDGPDGDVFSIDHTGSRVRRQHEPDYMNEYDPSLNLLVPQTFEPVSVENAKGVLMGSSSDEEEKRSGQKRGDKRARRRPKKGNAKTQKLQPEKSSVVKEKPLPAKEKLPPPPVPNEVAMLTRRMREKIRQEEKKVQSSDSESDSVPLTRKKDKDRKEKEIEKTKSKNEQPTVAEECGDNLKSLKNPICKPVDDDIQCNNVDSTEQIENVNDSPDTKQKFSGFTAVDQNEITSYQKYVKFVYDKILPKDTPSASPTNEIELEPSSNENASRPETPLIDYDEPAEMLECEVTMPMFDEEYIQKKTKSPRGKNKNAKNNIAVTDKSETHKEQPLSKSVENTSNPPIYNERDGWHCYPIDPKETKLYQTPALILDKLPEDFVETYFRYQEISDTRKEDEEVNRLINLNTLNRMALKEGKKLKLSGKVTGTESQSGRVLDSSRPVSPHSDGRDELTASEDEGANVDDEISPAKPLKSSDNHLAKDSLMNDSDSDEALSKIKQEKCDEESNEKPKPASKKKNKKADESTAPENLMLTADKMMNKELNLLHAPVVLSNELDKTGKEPSPKSKLRSGSKRNRSRDHIKNDEDSSSEEEKQWVTTKEKLLKRMVKKHDTATADDAKRAKLVCDFIERREGTDCRKRKSSGGRRRNGRKMLERQKQMRVLQHELLGTSLDPANVGPRHGQYAQSVFKGRRNIRKVIDKKSLARSTVISNMEEFERKRRLSQQQARLRELLGCEEGVNVLVINDEVCLEYGFEEQRPLVSVHPFFTRVMKAHQYEGVKFMWDACFESLEQVESGHPGGGCILAHCMGLGKTLQVLALLHTVLTHPRVGMQRVLVCCPLSTVLNWVDEIHKWIGPVTDQIKVFELSKLRKTYERAYQLEDWYSGGGIFIIGYELFRSLTTLDPDIDDVRPTIVTKIRTALLDPGPDIIVCDEGHLLKNDCSVLAVAMSRVATKRRIVLTGTPMQNNLREYYCMVNFIKPNLLGTYSEYSNRFENPIMNGQHRDSQVEDIKLMKQRTHILHKVLEGCLQRQEASVLYPYLPKKHEYTVFISLTQVQWDLYKHYLDNYSQKGNKHSILRDFHILQKIWSHPQVLHNFQMRRRNEAANKIKAEKLEDDLAREDLAATEELKPLETDEAWWLQYQQNPGDEDMLNCLASSNKFVVVFKILDECIALGDKVLIFSTSLFTMDALEYFLKKINKWGLGQEYYRLDGSVPAEVRQKWCREFNAEHNLKTKLFLISTRAGCLGLNMVAANRVIILDTSWNPAHDIQSIFRVYRFGQKKDCYIYRLVALGTMEQKIYERSVTKQAVACRVVDEQQIDRHYNMAELTELYKYDEEGSSVVSGVAVGVEDVALLRVARHPALHAVHEHDSLLRGSSEQQLPEHERAAAWMQFQQEHATKQMQNQLTSGFQMHMPLSGMMPNGMMVNIPSLQIPGSSQDQIKQETSEIRTVPPASEQKGKKGKKKQKELDSLFSRIPEKEPETYTDNADATNQPHTGTTSNNAKYDAKAEEANMVKQIMGLLRKHNFQERQGPKEIAELLLTVKKLVAYGKPPNAYSKLAKDITDVLLMKEGFYIAPAADDPMKKTIQKMAQYRKRGRPRKDALESSAPPTPQPSTSKIELDPEAFPGRRRAAINAEKQIDSINSNIDLDEGGNWQDADADWQGDSGGEEIIPETRAAKQAPIKQEKNDSVPATAKQTEYESIVLSDDEPEPKQVKIKLRQKKQTTAANKQTSASEKQTAAANKQSDAKPATTANKEEVIPLHPSLLSNKNFIKIVAHTYLEGNPMLDEDAATLAAQYSTLKAKKELESSGKPIISGPIYDIAIKVLGVDILKKLNKTNPLKIIPTSESAVKTEPGTSDKQPGAEPTPTATVTKPKSEARASEVDKRKPGPRLKARKLGELTESAPPAAPAPAPAAPAPGAPPHVVPVGFINRLSSLGAREPFAAPLATPYAAPEECILPDDDDVIIGSKPAAPHHKSLLRKNAKPLILNSVLSATSGAAQKREPIPKLVISAGKLMPLSKVTEVTAAPPQHSDTICLDSDEEEATTPRRAPPVKKRPVATKSTTKLPHKKPATAPALAPVPVSLTTSNPQLNAMLAQPTAPPSTMYNGQIRPHSSKPNLLVIPSGKLTKLPPGVRPAMHNLQPLPNFSGQSNPVPTAIHTGLGYMQPVYQECQPMIAQNYMAPVPTMLISPLPQPPLAPAPPPQLAPKPQSLPIKPKPENKTVCKPGDILRITASGAVEILNREGEDPVKAPPTPTPPVPEISEPSERLRRLRDRLSKSKSTADSIPPTLPKLAPKPAVGTKRPETPKKSPDRIRKISSSSSSSEESRPTTPDDDPLSILKDVVHIKAPEDSYPRNKPAPASQKPSAASSKPSSASSKPSPASAKPSPASAKPSPAAAKPSTSKPPTMVGTTSITRSGNKPNIRPGPASAPDKHLRGVVSKPQTSPKTPDEVRKHISQTDTILKKLDKTLGTSSKSTSKVDTIDLDAYELPSTSTKSSNKPADAKKQAPIKPKEASNKMEAAKKVVGTGKEIIISISGKSPGLSSTSGNKSVRVTSVEKIPSTSAKRPAALSTPPPQKKKKTEPMSLKDFNIDDIDDIIELD